jgi:hypothetical protein
LNQSEFLKSTLLILLILKGILVYACLIWELLEIRFPGLTSLSWLSILPVTTRTRFEQKGVSSRHVPVLF